MNNNSNLSSNNNKILNTIDTVMGVKEEKEINQQQEYPPLNGQKLLIYVMGTLAQIGFMTLTLWLINLGFKQLLEYNLDVRINTIIVSLFWIFFTIRSRLFSPLDNTRSRRQYDQVIRPKWAPPAFVFPIVWISIGVLRVVSSYLVWQELNQNFLALPLIIFTIHLALGDTWNTIFTVEGRYGLAVPVVIIGPLLSSFVLAYVYGQILPLAGWLIFPSCIWLMVASVLVINIWQLNQKD
ncbi:tryptophan-rich sensory protein [Cyanobacterium stanieri LEGE 03274]|uniref:Tryptophan-rich sensory protein n=1 Tax=Cyanobacterium stanieri LEGE 03274 TaxID=1828756 RepID=A0ABR9V3K7_9CHRO|nr:tryptophan-rich sensory protein [Cyanobacterium stanieri]MBE9222129.1 tryptophan-rich sensory protein [Cyanobacterium stanieri LEGE 03274]